MTKHHPLSVGLAQARREKSAREWRDIEQEEIARAVGVTTAAYSRWERGERSPGDPVILLLAAYFGVEPAMLRYRPIDDVARLTESAPPASPPTKEDLAAMTDARAGRARNIPLKEIDRAAAAKHAAKKGGGRRA